MADRRWRKWELAGLFITLIFGNLLHFVFDWSGENRIVAAFAAVNESTWEHMKLLVIPWVVWSLVEAVVLRDSRRPVLLARAMGLLAGVLLIPAVYYTYTGALGVSSMIVDVVLFQAAVLLGAWVSWRIMAGGKGSGLLCWVCCSCWAYGRCLSGGRMTLRCCPSLSTPPTEPPDCP